MVFLYVPGIGLLQSKKHPETAMFQVAFPEYKYNFKSVST
jgi:hypothetical protein